MDAPEPAPAEAEASLFEDPGPFTIATHVRGSMVLGSVSALRARGYFDAYAAHLDPELLRTILASDASGWVPMSIAEAHYRACDALNLTLAQQTELGADVFNRISAGFIGVLLRASRGLVSPWILTSNQRRLVSRLVQGGRATTVRVGPKEARSTLEGFPLLNIAYFRNSYRGNFLAMLELFATRVYIREVVTERRLNKVVFNVAWG